VFCALRDFHRDAQAAGKVVEFWLQTAFNLVLSYVHALYHYAQMPEQLLNDRPARQDAEDDTDLG
jgi:hypothetical protein